MSNSALNKNVVKTALDELFFQTFDGSKAPGHVGVDSPLVFNQNSSDRSAEIQEVNRGVGLYEAKGETANAPADSWQSLNQVTYTHTTFAKSVDLPKEYFDDDLHSQVKRNIAKSARKGRQTMDQQGFATYRNAFSTSFVGGDGQPLIDTDHPTKLSDASNEVASNPVFSESSLNTAIVQMWEQIGQEGVIEGQVPAALFVPPALYKAASQVLESVRRSATADNDLNVYSDRYGIELITSPWIGAAAGGSDTAWYLLSADHALNRFVREGLNTTLKNWDETRNHNYLYTARYRESTGFTDYAGIVASDGTGS